MKNNIQNNCAKFKTVEDGVFKAEFGDTTLIISEKDQGYWKEALYLYIRNSQNDSVETFCKTIYSIADTVLIAGKSGLLFEKNRGYYYISSGYNTSRNKNLMVFQLWDLISENQKFYAFSSVFQDNNVNSSKDTISMEVDRALKKVDFTKEKFFLIKARRDTQFGNVSD